MKGCCFVARPLYGVAMARESEVHELICPTCGERATVVAWWRRMPDGSRTKKWFVEYSCPALCTPPPEADLIELTGA